MGDLKAHFPSDEAFLKTLAPVTLREFSGWFDLLNKAAEKVGYVEGIDMAEATGIECWFCYFEDGYSPEEALDEDGSYD